MQDYKWDILYVQVCTNNPLTNKYLCFQGFYFHILAARQGRLANVSAWLLSYIYSDQEQAVLFQKLL